MKEKLNQQHNPAELFQECVRALQPYQREQLATLLQEYPQLFPLFIENLQQKVTPSITQEELIAAEMTALRSIIDPYER